MIVLNYHELVEASPSNPWCLTYEAFGAHLAVSGKRLISPHTFLEQSNDPKANYTDAVLLTFDDGFVSDYTHVFTRYVKTGLIPGFMSFIPVDIVGSPGRMSWQMVEELAKGGVAIGSHGMAHIDLTTASDTQLRRELTFSKATLEEHIGQEVALFAFPFGRFSRRVCDAALRAGYTHLFTIQLGYHRGFEHFLYSRFCVTNNVDANYIRQHLHDPNAGRGFAWRISTSLGLYRYLMRWRYR